MTLSMIEPIKAKDIQSIVTLKEFKVYLLRGFRHDEVIVKVENNIKESNVVMSGYIAKAIDTLAATRPLGPNELLELRSYARSLLEDEQFFAGIGGYNVGINQPVIQSIADTILTAPGQWTKIEKLRVLDLDASLQQKCAQNNGTAHLKFVTALTGPGGLEMIGEIVAADLFMGNGDRFDFRFDTGDTKRYGNITLNFKRLINVGNIMIAIDPKLEGKGGEGYRPVMLDYLDPNSPVVSTLKNFPKTRLKDIDTRNWPGAAILPSWERRQEAAEEVAHDLLVCADPFGENKGLFKHVGDIRVLAGIDSGIQKIVKHLNGRQMLPAYEDLYAVLKKSLK